MAKKLRLPKSGDDDEEKFYVRNMLEFGEDGLMISLFGIETIEKDMRFVENPNAHWEYGITINKGMEPSVRYPKTDISVWQYTQEKRDRDWELLMMQLVDSGFKVIQVN